MSGFSLDRRMLLQGVIVASALYPLRPAAAERSG